MTSNLASNVGGVLLDRPFCIRRLGHAAFDTDDFETALNFFARDLGLYVSDAFDLTSLPVFQDVIATLPDPRVVFLTTASDHHSIVLVPRPFARARRAPHLPQDIANGQISFQVGSLEEIVAAKAWLEEQGIEVPRIGRDLPGSNWHIYFLSPDGLTVELYYGMEQIGWQRRSKSLSLYGLAAGGDVMLPARSEHSEIDDAIASGLVIDDGHRHSLASDADHAVGGVSLPRPFRVIRPGPISFFVSDMATSVDFYTRLLGLKPTETVEYEGHICHYLRAGSEHHSLALLPMALRDRLGLPDDNRNFVSGFQLGSYDQLRRAGLFLKDRGWREINDLPHALHPGIDNRLIFEGPSGVRIMLYYYMEQIGWNNRPRPAEERLAPQSGPVQDWPEAILAPGDVYSDYPLMGPLG